MHAVWTLAVACLVALGGPARASVRVAPRTVIVLEAHDASPAGLHAIASHRHGPAAAARARGLERRLPPAALPAAPALIAPPRHALVERDAGDARSTTRPIATGSARGPPIA